MHLYVELTALDCPTSQTYCPHLAFGEKYGLSATEVLAIPDYYVSKLTAKRKNGWPYAIACLPHFNEFFHGLYKNLLGKTIVSILPAKRVQYVGERLEERRNGTGDSLSQTTMADPFQFLNFSKTSLCFWPMMARSKTDKCLIFFLFVIRLIFYQALHLYVELISQTLDFLLFPCILSSSVRLQSEIWGL